MKEKMISILSSLAVLFVLSLLVSLLLALLFMLQLINPQISSWLHILLGFIIYGIAGIVLGKRIHQKTFFIALGVALILGLCFMIPMEKKIINFAVLFMKLLIYALCSAFARKKMD